MGGHANALRLRVLVAAVDEARVLARPARVDFQVSVQEAGFLGLDSKKFLAEEPSVEVAARCSGNVGAAIRNFVLAAALPLESLVRIFAELSWAVAVFLSSWPDAIPSLEVEIAAGERVV